MYIIYIVETRIRVWEWKFFWQPFYNRAKNCQYISWLLFFYSYFNVNTRTNIIVFECRPIICNHYLKWLKNNIYMKYSFFTSMSNSWYHFWIFYIEFHDDDNNRRVENIPNMVVCPTDGYLLGRLFFFLFLIFEDMDIDDFYENVFLLEW